MSTKDLVEERGESYGHPLPRFYAAQTMNDAWLNLRIQGKKLDCEFQDAAINHGIYLIIDKLTRVANDPTHRDNLDDIQGYAETIKMVIDYNKELENAGQETT